MLTVVVKRTEEPKVIQLTQKDLAKQLWSINGAEVLLEDSWNEGLRKVRTPYVCLVEADCTLSANYFMANYGIMENTNSIHGGGNTKVAMISSCLGVRDFGNRIYNFALDKVYVPLGTKETVDIEDEIQVKEWHIQPVRDKLSLKTYPVQVGFVPGAIMRMTSIRDLIDDSVWDYTDLVRLSTAISFYLWDTNRRLILNSNTTYVSTNKHMEEPPLFDVHVPDKVANIFKQEMIGEWAI
jgi:hypothetical protein